MEKVKARVPTEVIGAHTPNFKSEPVANTPSKRQN
jgi:hypothetical protein